MRRPSKRRGLSLLEVMLATVVLAVVAVSAMRYAHQPSDRVKIQACDMKIAELQLLTQQYQADYGNVPSANLAELSAARYLGQPLPVCPLDGRSFQLNRSNGLVVPHGH